MTRATAYLVALIAVLPPTGAAQAPPSPGDRIRIRQVDGTVLTGTLDLWSTETVRLSGESADRRWEIPVSAIETLEMSLGRSHSFGKYYGLTVAVSSIVGGIIGLTKSSSSSSFHRGRSAGGGALVGYLVGIPLGAFAGSRITKERWIPVATLGPAAPGPTIRRVIGSEVGLTAGQRVRVRAADVPSVEGVFRGFEGENMLMSTTQAGQDQRIPTDRVQALWVRERNTQKGALIGAITGALFFTGAAVYLDRYILEDPGDVTLGVALGVGAVGAGLGGAAGAIIGYLMQGWSPVWP